MTRERTSGKCWLKGCSDRREWKGQPFCDHHWKEVPEDLKDRVADAYDGGTTVELVAALRACVAYLNS